MWKSGTSGIATVLAALSLSACTDGKQERTATDPDGHARVTSSHFEMDPITVDEGARLLPAIADARQLTAPRWLPQERVLAEYCATGSVATRAETLSAQVQATWQQVSVHKSGIDDRRGIRASRGGYALGVTLSPGRDDRCPADHVMVRMAVFKPVDPRVAGR